MAAKSVFISSTSEDLQPYRRAVFDTTLQLEMHPIDMQHFGSVPGDAVEVSLEKVANADYFVGIVAYRYGYVPPGMEKSVTEQEYDEAGRLDIPRLMYIVDPAHEWPPELVEADPVAQARLQAFKAKIDQQNVRTLFITPEQLAADVATDLANLLREDRELRALPAWRKWLQIVGTIVGILVGLTTIASFLLRDDIQDQFRRWEILDPEPMPVSTIETGLNMVVAGIGTQADDGTLKRTDLSQDISRDIYAQVQQFEGIAHHRGPDDIGVPTILNATRNERFREAEQLAKELNANLVIFGYIDPIGNSSMAVSYTPEIYVSVEWAQLEAEFLDALQFGEPIRILSGTDSEIKARIIALDLFLEGFSGFIKGEYDSALSTFENIIVETPDIAVVYLYAGNAAARMHDYDTALDYYTRSLSVGSTTYGRGLLGRAVGLKSVAIHHLPSSADTFDASLQWPAGTSCLEPIDKIEDSFEYWIDLVLICLSETENAPDTPEVADLDVKVAFQRGDLYAWLYQEDYIGAPQIPLENIQTVIDIYDNAEPDKQARIRTQAGIANSYKAEILLESTGDLDAAIALYRRAIEILEQDIYWDYAQRVLTGYRARLADLEAQTTN